MSKHPDWATKHRTKGTELRLINGHYYLYSVTSKWDPEIKRARKITGKILGKITEQDGFIESDKRKLDKKTVKIEKIVVKESGVTSFIENNVGDFKDLLKKHFPDYWEELLILSYSRFAFCSPFKNVENNYYNSYLDVIYPNLQLNPKNITQILKQIGSDRSAITNFFKEFHISDDKILFDGTDLISNSKRMDSPKLGICKNGTYDSLVNVMFAFSANQNMPVYYRIIPGDIKDIKAFKLCLKESGLEDVTIIADKGFISQSNIDFLDKEKIKYIIPLKRNSNLIDYSKLNSSDKRSFDGYFNYNKKIIWYYSIEVDEKRVCVFFDEQLKCQEEKDYLERIDKIQDGYTLENFYEKQNRFGTISMYDNSGKFIKDVYLNYKNRNCIEQMFDTLKNTFDADRSYMQTEEALEAWMFINFIVLQWYYRLFTLLSSNKLTDKYSPKDIINFLINVRKVKINDEWYLAEITKKNKEVL
ncbi:MAG: transposase, partial [Candidatus Delongbacteria bacterium]|nr:transposase [Candidatus Delongbacteria bacterium]